MGPPSKIVTVPSALSWFQKLIKDNNKSYQATEIIIIIIIIIIIPKLGCRLQ